LAREVMLKNELAGIPLVCIRPTLIFGPGDPHNGYGPNRFMRCVRAGQDIMLFGQGEERRDHVFIDDVAEIVARCALRRATGTINAVSGTVTSFRKIVDTPRVGAMPHNGYRAFDASLPARLFPDLRITTLAEGLERIAASVLP
jgi:UDP-glucose 4-epimerase